MDANSIYALIDVMILGSGIYVIYYYVLMMKTGEIRENALLPKGLNVRQCKDTAGFIRYTGTKQLIFGIIAILSGAIGLIQDFTQKIGPVFYMIAVGIFFVYVMWYGFMVKKAVKMFW